ncbi:phytanoyl-CoA dioxygenase family protein [Streptomyces inhibens]|uniref:phytanoyl-CoA dioxygenase family protein n=1 Tax=Streptomyces inhibens TaxID=2293571 RepID=UPI001EE6BEBA|nr:phytanoyl-CoA dioxygenase family protein [Streptomyces inhibens]UKY48231.1 phytanoyl-CoA dioxygenase family protein [Streptomyces inhibens]
MARDPMYDLEKELPFRVLTTEGWAHWKRWGYVIVRDVVPQEKMERLAATLWEFTGLDPHDEEAWYRPDAENRAMRDVAGSGMVEIYQHQNLWDIRQEPRLYDAFVDIWDREDLWVTLDRANLNPPNRRNRTFTGFIHWDIDTSVDPLPFGVQGVVSLVDTDPEMGGTQAYPELFRGFGEWLAKQPVDRDPWRPDTAGLGEPTPLPTNAGDLLIFNSLLAHGVRENTSQRQVRLAQYVSMFPADESNTALVQERITSWREKTAPKNPAFPGDPRGREKQDPVAVLTPLGERLLGLRSWRNSPVSAPC